MDQCVEVLVSSTHCLQLGRCEERPVAIEILVLPLPCPHADVVDMGVVLDAEHNAHHRVDVAEKSFVSHDRTRERTNTPLIWCTKKAPSGDEAVG